jgi:hypothetical protein
LDCSSDNLPEDFLNENIRAAPASVGAFLFKRITKIYLTNQAVLFYYSNWFFKKTMKGVYMDSRVSKLKSLAEEYHTAYHEAEIQNNFLRVSFPNLTGKQYGDVIQAGIKAKGKLAEWKSAYEIAVQAGYNIPDDCVPQELKVQEPQIRLSEDVILFDILNGSTSQPVEPFGINI